ncbi:hypothetical protein ACXY7D_18620 [Sphingomonas melonis]
MLEEYVITPDVFMSEAYLEPHTCGTNLRWLKDAILEDGLVRDLRDGGWSRFCTDPSTPGRHQSTNEIIKKLRAGNRLRKSEPRLDHDPNSTQEWLAEGLESYAAEPATGIVTAHATAGPSSAKHMASIEKLTGANWWRARSCSRDLTRTTGDYLSALRPILQQANSLMFIDPNLDPTAPNYHGFADLLQPLLHREVKPLIEIHRSTALGDGPARKFPDRAEWRQRFVPLHEQLSAIELKATILFWVDFHDRFLVSDLIGLSISAGFDTTADPTSEACWSRLGRDQRDARQRRFDPAVREDVFRFQFDIGAGT